MSKYKITGIIYMHIGMWREKESCRKREREREGDSWREKEIEETAQLWSSRYTTIPAETVGRRWCYVVLLQSLAAAPPQAGTGSAAPAPPRWPEWEAWLPGSRPWPGPHL